MFAPPIRVDRAIKTQIRGLIKRQHRLGSIFRYRRWALDQVFEPRLSTFPSIIKSHMFSDFEPPRRSVSCAAPFPIAFGSGSFGLRLIGAVAIPAIPMGFHGNLAGRIQWS